jgi:hypothetical protein
VPFPLDGSHGEIACTFKHRRFGKDGGSKSLTPQQAKLATTDDGKTMRFNTDLFKLSFAASSGRSASPTNVHVYEFATVNEFAAVK